MHKVKSDSGSNMAHMVQKRDDTTRARKPGVIVSSVVK